MSGADECSGICEYASAAMDIEPTAAAVTALTVTGAVKDRERGWLAEASLVN